MKKILIINLARFGDIVQTFPAVAGLIQKYPGCRITLMVNKTFSEVCRVMPGVFRVVEVDFKQVHDLITAPGGGVTETYAFFKGLFDDLRSEKFERIISLTPHDIGVVMTFLAGDDFAFWSQINGWSKYYLNITRDWRSLTLNVVDLFKRVCGVGRISICGTLHFGSDAKNYADRFLVQAGVEPGDLLIGLQCGASIKEKKWPVSYFIKCAKQLIGRLNARIILFGGASDSPENQKIADQLGASAVNLSGRTSIEQLCAFMQRTDILVTNDTGPMHIAAFCGTRVVCINMGKEICETTGPYGIGHVCLQPRISCYPCDAPEDCAHGQCRSLIRPEDVCHAVSMLCGKSLGSRDSRADFYVSAFDAEGALDYLPLFKKRLDFSTFGRKILRRLFDLTLEDEIEGQKVQAVSAALCAFLEKHFDLGDSELLIKEAEQKTDLLLEMAAQADQALSLLGRLCELSRDLQQNVRRVRMISKSLDETEKRILQTGQNAGCFNIIISLFKFEIESLQGKTVFEMARETEIIYARMKQQLEMASDIISYCLQYKLKLFIKQKIA